MTFGKYGPDFQARLRDPTKRADHSTAGAVWAFERLPQTWGRLLAHVVAGHHAGLKDDLLSPDGRIETKRALLTPVERTAQADGLVLPQSVSGPTGIRRVNSESGFQIAFLTRMIFSCLIDADRTAAAAFDAHGDDVHEVDHPSIAALETALHEWMGRRAVATIDCQSNRTAWMEELVTVVRVECALFTILPAIAQETAPSILHMPLTGDIRDFSGKGASVEAARISFIDNAARPSPDTPEILMLSKKMLWPYQLRLVGLADQCLSTIGGRLVSGLCLLQ